MVGHHNFCHDLLKSFLFFSNLIGLVEISYYAEFHFLIHLINWQYFINFVSAMKFCDYYHCFAKLQLCVNKVLIETVANTTMHSPHGCAHMYVL